MKFVLKIELSNTETVTVLDFLDARSISDILHRLATTLDRYPRMIEEDHEHLPGMPYPSGPLEDGRGNKVGSWEIISNQKDVENAKPTSITKVTEKELEGKPLTAAKSFMRHCMLHGDYPGSLRGCSACARGER